MEKRKEETIVTGIKKVNVFCPLYKAENYIDNLIDSLKHQENVEISAVFSITESENCNAVIDKIVKAGYSYFLVKLEEFSHSLTRQKAIEEYCKEDIVFFMSQDVILFNNNCIAELANSITDEVVYAYGKQICKGKTIEHYVRMKNYGEDSYVISSDDIERLQLRAFFSSDAFSACNRNVFLKLGGYDNIHMMMSEDMYYAKKVLENGYKKAYVATAVVEHSHKLTLKQLYKRYYETGIWFFQHPEFNNYKPTDSGMKLAISVLGEALKDFNIPVLLRWLPDMTARYLGMRKGKRSKK